VRILIVEDDATLAGLVETVARRRGHEATVFDSVTGVLDAIDPPCTVLLDLTLVEGDAPSLVREIRRNPATAAARVVLLSGNRDIEAIARDCGADAWMRKPFGLADLEKEMTNDK
jgi:two-component system, OmpR family, response regulator VicR